MATVDFNIGSRNQAMSANSEGSPSVTTGTDDLPLFRFGLRQLLVFVAAFSALLAALSIARGLTVLVILLAVAVVVMHVFATAIGTQLQSRANRERTHQLAERLRIDQSHSLPIEQSANIHAIRSAPRSPWHGRGATYLPWLPSLVIGATVCGGICGGTLLGTTIGHRSSIEGIIVGAASFAILGGWFSFLVGNFYGVFRHGIREALLEQQKDQSRRWKKKELTSPTAAAQGALEQYSIDSPSESNLAVYFYDGHTCVEPFAKAWHGVDID